MKFLQNLFKDPNQKVLDELRLKVEEINSLEPRFEALSDAELAAQTPAFKERLAQGETLDDILVEAFAVVRETSKRMMNMRHYDVQMMGGIVLHRGQIAEMRTGEGKTLTSTLPIYLNALAGKGVHVITVNDYLAARDAVWMGQIFDFHGLTISCIQNQMTSFIYDKNQVANEDQKDQTRDETGGFSIVHDYLRTITRQEAYKADITYGTNNEFGFDYLRDNMAQDTKQFVQRDLAFALIDEIDSILIDEARTPLIISAPAQQSAALYGQFATLVTTLVENEDYNIDEKMRSATLTEDGLQKMEQALGVDNLYAQGGVQLVHHLEQALKAQVLFTRDKDYVVRDNEIVIIDEFTGRMMPGRRYSEGLHQAIEAKEGVTVQRESQTLATITFQNLFRLYEKLGGMTGTAATEAEEFQNIYELEVVVIPTNKEIARIDLPDKVFKNESGKFTAIVAHVKELQKTGQPVLIGTVSIDKNEQLAQMLQKAGIKCQTLNAKNHEQEAQIIAQAGKRGAVTVATNMAGRGVDIVLGGNPSTKEETQAIKDLGGLFVIGTERHESRRIDNQLRGRAGRQGDPGNTQFFISMDDEVMRIFGSEKMKAVMDRLGLPDDMPIENKFISRSIESAQKRVEGHNFDIRKHVLEYDDVLNKHRSTIYTQRKEVVESDNVRQTIMDMIENEIEQVVSFHTANEAVADWNIKEILEVAQTIFAVSDEMKAEIEAVPHNMEKPVVELRTEIIEILVKQAHALYEDMEQQVTELSAGTATMHEIEKSILLRTYDTLWVEHLDAMHHLRIGIGLRGYGQRDPLVEYKKEAFRLFTELQNLIQKQVVYLIFKITFSRAEEQAPPSVIEQQQAKIAGSAPAEQKGKVGRNDECSCGSSKKYKKCCGK
jgi:preprotein translocase subunit SecA